MVLKPKMYHLLGGVLKTTHNRFLRDELESLAVAQEEAKAGAERLGCVRFEPMEKVQVPSKLWDMCFFNAFNSRCREIRLCMYMNKS